jgi:trigger factor
MQVSVETTSVLGRRLIIQIPVEKVEEATENRLKTVAKKAKIDGFRPGKVPQKVIQERFGESARQEALNEILQSTLYEAIMQEKLVPAGQPEVKVTKFEVGKPLEYEVDLEIYPEIKLVKLDDAEVEQYNTDIVDADVDKVIENLRKQQVKWEDVDRPAQNDDQVTIDFEGFVDDKPFEGGKASATPLVLGSNSMIPGFEEGIVGAKAGDEIDVKIKFPEKYHSKELADKDAVFKIKVNKVSEPKLPELNDEFCTLFGVKEGGMEELRKKLRLSMEMQVKDAVQAKNKAALLDKVLELNKIELPKALVDREIDNLYASAIERMAPNMPADKRPDIPKDIFKDQAVRRVSLGLLMSEVVKEHELKSDPERVRELVESFSESQKDPKGFIEWYYADKKRLAQFEQVSVEEQVIAELIKSAKVKEKKISFDEVMTP